MKKRLLEPLILVIFIVATSLLLVLSHRYFTPQLEIRPLAVFYLVNTYNPQSPYTANSPEAVTAIVWDYRGLDTLYETMVFFLALIGGLALARGASLKGATQGTASGERGLSLIVKTVTRITAPMIVAVGASIGLHGHLTPGGGFQGGATIAVVPMVIIIVFSVGFLIERNMRKEQMLVLRSIGLIGIGLTAISVYLAGLALGVKAYVFQNMAKPNAPISAPATLGGQLISGTLWFFNLFEMIAVAAGFVVAFLVVSSMRGERK